MSENKSLLGLPSLFNNLTKYKKNEYRDNNNNTDARTINKNLLRKKKAAFGVNEELINK